MRFKRIKFVAELVLGVVGICATCLAVFAYQLHIDHNRSWGFERSVFFFVGLTSMILYGLLAFTRPVLNLPIMKRMIRGLKPVGRAIGWLVERENDLQGTEIANRRAHKSGWFAVAGAVVVILIAWWYISAGRLVRWSPSSIYFDQLADGFLSGQLSLPESPPAALMALADPYPYENRSGVSGYIWDASLYQGKYYYYWGPVPALMASVPKIFGQVVVQDQFLLMFAIIGLAITLAAIFHWLQKHFFPQIPGWFVFSLTLLGVLNTPVFWLVNMPRVYEASIAIAQFFLILGLFLILRGMAKADQRLAWLSGAGLAWGASIGTRANNAVAIAWMTGLACLYLILKSKTKTAWIKEVGALLVPMALWGGGLAWYNYARFGSVLETGHRFQLSRPGLPTAFDQLFSIHYVMPNLYSLLIRPFDVNWHAFPFFFTPNISRSSYPKPLFFPRDPLYFFYEPIAGIFACMWAAWLVFLPVTGFVKEGWNWLHERSVAIFKLKEWSFTTWTGWMVDGAALGALAILALFATSNMRYEADITPLLVIGIAVSMGWTSNRLISRPRLRRVVLILAGGLCVVSIAVTLLINFQNPGNVFLDGNPALYHNLAHFFTGN